ncbi:hypothetical protein BY996DRAFT_6574522 [Phakopsora pachyrhizi]|nr:hypothetical protein BY996DRAFT_6574522 [Phakopsora pachyrhizi]
MPGSIAKLVKFGRLYQNLFRSKVARICFWGQIKTHQTRTRGESLGKVATVKAGDKGKMVVVAKAGEPAGRELPEGWNCRLQRWQ